MAVVAFIVFGLAAGVLGGMFGIGGGVIIVPALVYGMKFTQHQAQGTSLASLLAPIGILAVINYAKAGQVNFIAAAWVAAGFLVGAFYGSGFAIQLNDVLMRKCFAVFLAATAIYTFFKK